MESVYEEALAWELLQRGLAIQRQILLPIPYKGQVLDTPPCDDLLLGEMRVQDGIHRVVNGL